MMRSAGFVILALCCISLQCTNARPWSEDQPENGDDPDAKYEVYVPDSTGQMSPQLMTLPEIRGLLARQGAEDELKAVSPLDGVNADAETPSDPTVDVADVVSSVQTIVAEEIAQREQVDKEEAEQPAANEDDSVFVVMAVDGQDETVVDIKPLSDEKEAQPEYVHIINVAGENLAPGETVEEAEKVEDVPNEAAESQDVEEARVVEEADQVSLMEEEVDVSEPTNVLDEQHTEVARSELSQEEAEEEEEEEEVEDEAENREAAEDEETEEDDEAIERIDVVDDEEEESEDEVEERDNDEEEEEEEIEEDDAEESTARFLDVEDDETSVVDETLDQLVKPMSYQNQLGEHHHDDHHHDDHHHDDLPTAVFGPIPEGNSGLAATSKDQDKELRDLTCASNRLAWKVWKNSVSERSVESNDVFSPLALTSALGIAFLGSRGSTAETIDTALGLDRLTSKNPHLHLQQVARDLDASEYFNSQQTHVVFANESLGQLNDVFQARVDTLYGAATARNSGDLKKQLRSAASSFAKSSLGEAMQKEADVSVASPFSVLSMAHLKVDWPSTSPSGDDEEEFMNFLNLPSAAQVSGRRLVPVSTVQTNGSFYAGYDPTMDATVVALPLYPVQEGREEQYFSFEPSNATKESLDDAGHLSLVLVMPGSASQFQAGGSGLAALEARLAQDPEGWNSLLKHTTQRHLHVKFPQLAKESHLNLGRALMGVQTSSNPADSPANLANLFDPEAADFSAISSRKPLYLSDISQMVELTINSVATQPDDEQLGRMNKNQPAGAAKKKTGTRATCPHSAVKKASGKKPAANKQTQKAPAKATGQKVQAKPVQKAPAKNGQKKPANQKSPSKVNPKKTAATTRPISGNLPGKKTTSTKSKVGAASKPKAKPNPTNKQPANKKPTAVANNKKPTTANRKPVANKKPTAVANNKKPTTANRKPVANKKPTAVKPTTANRNATVAATNKRPAPAKKPAASGKKPVASKPATANKNQAKPATGVKAPANKPKPATGVKAPANKPKPATSGAKAPANKPKPATSGAKAPANKPKPATGVKAPANKPKPATGAKAPAKKPVASGAKAPANKPKPAASGVKAPANKPKPVASGAKAPANKPKPATGVKAPANKPKPVASGAKAPANKPKPVASGAKAPANKPKPAASGAKAPANKPKPVAAKVPANKPKPVGAKAPAKPVAAKAPAKPVASKAPAANKGKPQANAAAKRPAQTKPKAPAKSPAPTLAKVAGCKNKTTAAQKQPQTPAKTVPTNAKNQPANKPVANNNRKTQSHRQTREAPELPVAVAEVEQQIRIADDDFQRLVINRAFIYAVRHNPTGLLTMIGRYVHP